MEERATRRPRHWQPAFGRFKSDILYTGHHVLRRTGHKGRQERRRKYRRKERRVMQDTEEKKEKREAKVAPKKDQQSDSVEVGLRKKQVRPGGRGILW